IANPQMPEIGERFLGTVVKTTTFGAFVSLLPGKDGLLHISEIRKMVGGKRIDAVEDVLSVGQKVQVELKEIDPRGKLSLAAVTAEGADSREGGESHSEAGSDEHGSDDHGSDGQGHGDDNGGERREGGERRQRNRRRGGGRGRGDRGDNGGHGGGDHSES
ncbi:MAG TPA: S1 RNA-binding domain-containing protein, partial [Phycicoccus sp.]|nr:S1 RNA-binding domain-containing protein [Phycicoccus sp.]